MYANCVQSLTNSTGDYSLQINTDWVSQAVSLVTHDQFYGHHSTFQQACLYHMKHHQVMLEKWYHLQNIGLTHVTQSQVHVPCISSPSPSSLSPLVWARANSFNWFHMLRTPSTIWCRTEAPTRSKLSYNSKK